MPFVTNTTLDRFVSVNGVVLASPEREVYKHAGRRGCRGRGGGNAMMRAMLLKCLGPMRADCAPLELADWPDSTPWAGWSSTRSARTSPSMPALLGLDY